MGCNLSQGQKQRVSIARAVIKNSEILILDETMSFVDSQTESKIIDNIWKEYNKKPVIVVSHRISTIEITDCVYFIENNSNVIKGKHKA